MKKIKELVKQVPCLLKIYSWFAYQRWQPPDGDFNDLLQKNLNKENIFFIQIGANDGIQDDPIKEHIEKKKWKGILVEPQRQAFECLKRNYIYNNSLIFENVAITSYNGKINLYRPVGKEQSPLASLSDSHIGKFGFTTLGAEQVNCITFNELLSKNNVNKVDILVIDTEGHDYQILCQVDFLKITPKIILYEYIHIPVKDYKSSLRLLKKHDYKMYKRERDIIAVRNSIQD